VLVLLPNDRTGYLAYRFSARRRKIHSEIGCVSIVYTYACDLACFFRRRHPRRMAAVVQYHVDAANMGWVDKFRHVDVLADRSGLQP